MQAGVAMQEQQCRRGRQEWLAGVAGSVKGAMWGARPEGHRFRQEKGQSWAQARLGKAAPPHARVCVCVCVGVVLGGSEGHPGGC